MIPRTLLKPMLAAFMVTLPLTACASSGGTARPSRDQPITIEELEQELAADLYTVVSRLRPRWMRARGERTLLGQIGVSLIVEGVPWASNLERLREIRVSDVREIRYLSASDATTQYGPDMAGGAVLVFLRGR
jgi:hypothetical protein